jgi:hydrogenase small subunit
VVLQYATAGTLPALDDKKRPLFAFDRHIHDHCPRRPHFDAGRFAEAFGDEGSRLGYCLYKLGCKGPQTHANCSTNHFCEVPGAWPIGVGHPCFGCTEKGVAFTTPQFDLASIERPTPPDTYPPVVADRGGANPIATGVGGLIAGALVGAGVAVSRKLSRGDGESSKEKGS